MTSVLVPAVVLLFAPVSLSADETWRCCAEPAARALPALFVSPACCALPDGPALSDGLALTLWLAVIGGCTSVVALLLAVVA